VAEEAVGVEEEGEAEEDGAEDGEDGGGAVAVWSSWLVDGMVWHSDHNSVLQVVIMTSSLHEFGRTHK
jgi:hypothetical protein